MARAFHIAIGIFIVCFSLTAAPSDAKVQRMVLAKQTIVVGGGNGGSSTTYTGKAYCLDRYKPAPPAGSPMPFVVGGTGGSTTTVTDLTNNVSVSLEDAIKQKWITFEGEGPVGLTVRSLTGNKYRVELGEPVAVADNPNEIRDDIASTLEWLKGKDVPANKESFGQAIWNHRHEAAEKALGSDTRFASKLSMRADALLADKLKIEAEASKGANIIGYTHAPSKEDVFARIVLSPGRPIAEFNQPDADARIVQEHLREGRTLRIEVFRIAKSEHTTELNRHWEGEIDRAFAQLFDGDGDPTTDEINAALAKESKARQNLKKINDRVKSIYEFAFRLTSRNLVPESKTVTLSDPEPLADAGGGGDLIVTNGALLAFDGDKDSGGIGAIPGTQGGGSFLPPRLPIGTISEDKVRRSAHANGKSGRWALVGESARAFVNRLDAAMSNGYAALRRAMLNEESPKEIADAVLREIELDSEINKPISRPGTIRMRLFRNGEQLFDMRVAEITTANGIRYARID